MKAGKRYQHGKARKIGNRLLIFALLSVICLVNIPQPCGTRDSTLSNRLDLSTSLVDQNRLFRPVLSVNGLRKANVFFHAFHDGTISAFDFPVTLPTTARLIKPPRATTPASISMAYEIRVRAPPLSLFF